MVTFAVDDLVRARHPQLGLWREAKVVEPAPSDASQHVSVKFIGTSTVHKLGIVHVKPKPKAAVARSVVDLTDVADDEPLGREATPPATPATTTFSDPFKTPPPEPFQKSAAAPVYRYPASKPLMSRTSQSREPPVVSDPYFAPSLPSATNSDGPGFPAEQPPRKPYATLQPVNGSSRLASAAPSVRAPVLTTSPSPVPTLRPKQPSPQQFPSLRQHHVGSHHSAAQPEARSPKFFFRPLRSTPPQLPKLKPLREEPHATPAHPHGLRVRDHGRHPVRSVDDTLRIPRTKHAATGAVPVPRHPQTAVHDDDLPIPRNIKSSSREHQDSFTVQEGTARPTKPQHDRLHNRERVYYDLVAGEQLPPPSPPKDLAPKMSHRLAKRRRVLSLSSVTPFETPPPGQRLQARLVPVASIRIAPSFQVSQRFPFAPGNLSETDQSALKVCQTSAPADEQDLPEIGCSEARELEGEDTLFRRGRRKKGTPRRKRCVSPHSFPTLTLARNRDYEADVDSASRTVSDIPDRLLGENVGEDVRPVPRIYSCPCNKMDPHAALTQEGDGAIQCRSCGLWTHVHCAQLDDEQLAALKSPQVSESTMFLCLRCTEQSLETRKPMPSEAAMRDRLETSWQSQIKPLVEHMSVLSVASADEVVEESMPNASTSSRRLRVREALSKKDVDARRQNVERLRTGLQCSSVGSVERVFADKGIIGKRYANPARVN